MQDDIIKFAISHGADVHNYGDVLFPRILKQEISQRIHNASFEFFAASDAKCGDLNSKRIDQQQESQFDVSIFAGGEVIHRFDDMLLSIYKTFGHNSIDNPTDLIFKLSESKAKFKALIAIGSPNPSNIVLEDLPCALSNLDHISVRGKSSFRIMQSATATPISIVPDIGWLIPKLARKENWQSRYLKELYDIENISYIAAQAIPGNVHSSGGIENAVNALLDCSVLFNMPVVLVPLTDCWDDDAVHNQMKLLSNDRFIVIPKYLSYEERGKIVSESFIYIGQSLHGSLTAASHGRPGFLVCAHDNDQKFRETMDGQMMREWRATSWSQLSTIISRQKSLDFRYVSDISSNANVSLNTYFNILCDLIVARLQSYR